MQVHRFQSPQAFYERVAPLLMRDPAKHNLPLGVCYRFAQRGTIPEDAYLVLIEDEGEVVAMAFRTPPYNLVLSELPPEAAPLLAQDVYDRYGTEVRGVNGTDVVCEHFLEAWQNLTGMTAEIEMPQRIYQLSQVIPVTGVSGKLRPFQEHDRPLVGVWIRAFVEGTSQGTISEAEIQERMDSLLQLPQPALFVWEDEGVPVSMTAIVRPNPGGAGVSWVYTPPESRRRGYASACVAGVSTICLERGYGLCYLYTDLRNPTSNHIYQAIGYEPVCNAFTHKFV